MIPDLGVCLIRASLGCSRWMLETIAHPGLGVFVTTAHPGLGLHNRAQNKS